MILYIFCIINTVSGYTFHILPFRRRGLRDGAGSLRFSFIAERLTEGLSYTQLLKFSCCLLQIPELDGTDTGFVRTFAVDCTVIQENRFLRIQVVSCK